MHISYTRLETNVEEPFMVILLVIVTITLGVGLESLRRGRKSVASERIPALSPPVRRNATAIVERYFHPGYSWVELPGRDVITVGADDIVPSLLGRIEKIEIVTTGSEIHQGEPFATVRRRGRSLTLAAPMTGILAEVNPRLAEHPSLLNDSPYERGWIARILPTRMRVELGNLFRGVSADRWRDSIRMEIGLRFSPRCGPALQDGGRWIENPAELLSVPEWEELVRDLFPLSSRRAGAFIKTNN
jgi:glycine cleavage system H protein